MGLLSGILDKASISRAKKELAEFVSNLKGMGDEEIGLVVALATDARHILEAKGHDLLNPRQYAPAHLELIPALRIEIQELQRHGAYPHAAGTMVWLHTLRACVRQELENLDKDMWKELARGIPKAAGCAEGYTELTGIELNIAGFDKLPKNLALEMGMFRPKSPVIEGSMKCGHCGSLFWTNENFLFCSDCRDKIQRESDEEHRRFLQILKEGPPKPPKPPTRRRFDNIADAFRFARDNMETEVKFTKEFPAWVISTRTFDFGDYMCLRLRIPTKRRHELVIGAVQQHLLDRLSGGDLVNWGAVKKVPINWGAEEGSIWFGLVQAKLRLEYDSHDGWIVDDSKV